MLTVGRGLSGDLGGNVTHLAWHVIRWPVALGLAAAAFGGSCAGRPAAGNRTGRGSRSAA
jgi:hypothetical protein